MSTELTADNLSQAAKALTGKGPIQMVNLLRYFQDAHYPAATTFRPVQGEKPTTSDISPNSRRSRAK